MAREQVLEGVILRRWTSGESDRVVSFLTAERGKLRLKVRGTQKPNSRMGLLTEPLNRLNARVIEGRHQRLLVQPQLVRTYLQVRTDLERLSAALALCETLDRWLAEEHAEPEAYFTLVQALERLEQGSDVATVVGWALWRWLALLGYAPDLSRCRECGHPVTGGDWQLDAGGCVCARCMPSRSNLVALPADQVQRIQQWFLQAQPPQELISGAERLVRAALRYAESVVDAEPRWLTFWERLNALRENG